MSQSSQAVPTVSANIAGNRQQVNLRDYLNQRVAPFLKKAIHESLETEAEFPLQWLGEHLIQQSILYEGNPDHTNIRERFVYKHEIPAPQPATATATTEANSVAAPPSIPEQAPAAAPTINGEAADTPMPLPTTESSDQTNGVTNGSQTVEDRPRDTEMSGTT